MHNVALRFAAVLFVTSAALACRGDGSSPTPSATSTPTTTSATTPIETQPTQALATATPEFASAIAVVSKAQREAMLASGSWREGCPVSIDDLRVLSLRYRAFDGTVQQGELMVHADVAEPVVEAFRQLLAAEFPLRRMDLVDVYGADDEASMQADNTSAFNCRSIPGSTAWSQHAYGRAVDLNPLENPEVRDGNVDPPEGAPYVDRTQQAQGMIHDGDAAVAAFASIGWSWGGFWTDLKDYQHFSLTGN